MLQFNEIDWNNILYRVQEKSSGLILEEDHSNKLKSETISSTIVSETKKYFCEIGYNVLKERSDNDPDLTFVDFNNHPVEIKVAYCSSSKTDISWRGGSYSKRPGQYVLVSWSLCDGKLMFFASTCIIEESAWEKSESDSYYATTFSLKKLYEKNRIDLIGSLSHYNDKVRMNFREITELKLPIEKTTFSGEILNPSRLNDTTARYYFEF